MITEVWSLNQPSTRVESRKKPLRGWDFAKATVEMRGLLAQTRTLLLLLIDTAS